MNPERLYTEEDCNIAVREAMRELVKLFLNFIASDRILLREETGETSRLCIETKIDTLETVIRIIQEDYLS